MRANLSAAVLAVVIAALGVPVGVLWWLVAPQAEVTVVEGGIRLTETAAQVFFAADGWFAIFTLVAGVGCGWVTVRRDRPAGHAAAVALVIGSVLAALVAWQVGEFLGSEPDPLDEVASAPVGATLPVGLGLRATGVLLLWAIGALGTFLAATLAAREPDEIEASAWAAYHRHRGAREPDEVGRRELDLEAAPPGGDEHGREPER